MTVFGAFYKSPDQTVVFYELINQRIYSVQIVANLEKHPQSRTRSLSSGQVLLYLQENDHKKVTDFHDQNVNVY